MAGEPILVVDDNLANLKLARFALEGEGYDVRTAIDGDEALKMLREFPPRLILMDVQLPGVDGLELTRRLKADPVTRDIVVVAVTAHALKGDREKALRAGCDGYITKPLDLLQLSMEIGGFLGRPKQPLVQMASVAPAVTTTSLPAAAAGRASSAGTVLVVEDNPATRKMFRVTLEIDGFEVLEAVDGRSALALAAERQPDLVVQDLGLPDMNGFDLTKSLRSLFGEKPIPIVCVTGFLAKLDEARTLKAGFTHVLVKPVDPGLLRDVVRTYVAIPSVHTHRIGEQRKLLVVDDDPLHRKVAQGWFLSAGFEVLLAGDGVEALEIARRERPCAIVSDVLMPRMDGFELCLAVRRDSELSTTPVILVSSAYTEPADQTLARHVGASAFVLKTDGPESAAHAVAAALSASPPSPTSESLDLIEGERTKRALRQLDRQIQENMRLRHRATFQEAELAVLSGVANALSLRGDMQDVLSDMFATCLDMAGISKGAIYSTNTGRFQLRHQIGFSEDEVRRLRVVFDCEEFLADVATRGKVVCVPSPEIAADLAQRLIGGTGVKALLFVPVGWAETTYGLIVLGATTTQITSEDALAFARVLASQMGQGIELERAFTSLRASELRYRTLTENANDAISIMTPEGTICEVNQRFTEILGYPAELLVGRNIREFAAAGQEQEDKPSQGQLLVVGSGSMPPVAFGKADGGVALLEFSNTGVQVGGEPIVFSIGRDVTDQVQAQAQLMVADRMASVGTLAAGVAHEINNPLAVVLANLDFAVEDTANLASEVGSSPRVAQLQESLCDAREAAERVRLIVKDLKIFSRAEEDKRGAVDTQRVLESTLRMAQNEIRHRARLVKMYGKVPPVDANESRLGQVFLNLVVNAAQAIAEGRADTNEIRVTTSTDSSGRVVVEIRDTGPGIPPETLKNLFTPFFTTKAAGVGTGLGLAICKRIVTGLGGEITVESQVGVGTAFKVFLPVARGEVERDVAVSVAAPAARRGRVLLVDDDPMIGKAVRRTLSGEHDIKILTSAQEALDCITAGQHFDVIICDMMMPVLTGMEFYDQLLESVRDQAERIVFLTGGAFTVRAREFLDRVPNARLEKPFEVQNLRALVNERVR